MDTNVIRCSSCGQANRVPDVGPGLGNGKKVVCGKCKAPLDAAAASDGHPLTVTDASFGSVIAGPKPVVVDFWAPWCGPCRTIGPIVEGLAKERTDVTFGKLNVDDNPRTSAQFQVSGIPTLVFFRNGKEAGRVVGAVGKPQLESALRQYFG